MRKAKVDILFSKMKIGEVYRRSDLEKYSSSVGRHLAQLVKAQKVMRVSNGLYSRPRMSAFGAVPPDENKLIASFIRDHRFLITSYNYYNQLGLGLTQLYNIRIVYNFKRNGEYEICGWKFQFKKMSKFPRKLTKEFLLVDMLNNLKYLAEDQNQIVEIFYRDKGKFNSKKALAAGKKYGRSGTWKILEMAYLS